MAITTNVGLELIYYGQQGWSHTIGENAVKIDDIFEEFPLLWNQVSQNENSPLMWDTAGNEWVVGSPVMESPLALTDAATISVNASERTMFTVTLGGNRAIENPTNLVDGKKYFFYITQDLTGNRTLSWGNAYYFPGGSCTLSTTADRTDLIRAICVGSNLFCTVVSGFANIEELTSTAIVTGQPVIGTPTLELAHYLESQDIYTDNPIIGTPTLDLTIDLESTDIITGAPTIGSPELVEFDADNLIATDIVTGAPIVGSPTLTEPQDELIATDIVTGAPIVGSPIATGDTPESLVAKSIIIDITEPWDGGSEVGFKKVEIKKDATIIAELIDS